MLDNLVMEARNTDITEILSFYGVEFYKNSCKCIFHDDNNRSAFITNGNRLRCHSCNCSLSAIDVVQHFENIHNIREAAKKVLELKGTPIKTVNYFENEPIKKKKLSFQDRKNICENKNIIVVQRYLNSRGISKKILDILDKNNITYGADKFNQVHFFFNRQQYCIYRSIKLDKNFNCGNPTPLCIKSNDSNLWYIVEGIYDGLSLLQTNKNVIILNSVSNVEKLIYKIESTRKLLELEYVIATDNDEPGLKAKYKLEEFFTKNNVKFEIFDILYNSKFKDVNDLLKNNLI